MTIDSEGMIWVAQWGGSKCDGIANGERLEIIRFRLRRVTSCTFRENLDELYITTARISLVMKLQQQPYAGGVFRIKVGVRRNKSYSFRGNL